MSGAHLMFKFSGTLAAFCKYGQFMNCAAHFMTS